MSKRVFFLTFILLSPYLVLTQSIQAGMHWWQDYFIDITPDSSVYTIITPYYSAPSNTMDFFVDINGDNINDFKLSAIYSNGKQWYQRHYGKITPLNNNNVAISHFDSCFTYMSPPVFQYTTPLAKSFLFQDTIHKNATWIDSAAFIAYYDSDAHYWSCDSTNFVNGPGYVGVKVFVPNDTLYGWIKVKVTRPDSMIIYEYACNMFSTGIESHKNNCLLKIYPNPTSDQLYFECPIPLNRKCNFTIYDSYSRVVMTERINSSKTINIKQLTDGMYYLVIDGVNGKIAKSKFAVQR